MIKGKTVATELIGISLSLSVADLYRCSQSIEIIDGFCWNTGGLPLIGGRK